MFYLVLAYIYLLIIYLLNGRQNLFDIYLLFWIVDVMPISYVIIHICNKKKMLYFDFERIVIYAGIIEAVLVFCALISPTIQSLFIKQMIAAGHSESFLDKWSFRTYGFASNLQYSSALVMATIALLAINRMFSRKKYRLFIVAIILVIASYVNARTSLVVFVVGIVGLILLNIKDKKKLKQIFKVCISVFIAFIALLYYLSTIELNEQTTWLRDGVYEILAIFSDKYVTDYSTIEVLMNEKRYILPSNILNILFGTGTYIMARNEYYVNSDIGYVNDIWYGGVVYAICIYVFFLRMLKKIKLKNLGSVYFNNLTFVMLISIVIANIKGYIFGFNNLSTLILIIYVYIIGGKKHGDINLR